MTGASYLKSHSNCPFTYNIRLLFTWFLYSIIMLHFNGSDFFDECMTRELFEMAIKPWLKYRKPAQTFVPKTSRPEICFFELPVKQTGLPYQ